MSPTRQIKLGLFVRPAGNHIASWRHPTRTPMRCNFQRSVEWRTAERPVDMLFRQTRSRHGPRGRGHAPTALCRVARASAFVRPVGPHAQHRPRQQLATYEEPYCWRAASRRLTSSAVGVGMECHHLRQPDRRKTSGARARRQDRPVQACPRVRSGRHGLWIAGTTTPSSGIARAASF
jgi:hypothetical protein